VKELMSVGIRPRILLCRSDRPIEQEELRKIGLFCNIDENKGYSGARCFNDL
jgi:CTP synthase